MAVSTCPGVEEQRARCNDECGDASNVFACGECDYSRATCRDPTAQYCNANSYLFGVEPCPDEFTVVGRTGTTGKTIEETTSVLTDTTISAVPKIVNNYLISIIGIMIIVV